MRTITGTFRKAGKVVKVNISHVDTSYIDEMNNRGFSLLGVEYSYPKKETINNCKQCGKVIPSGWMTHCTTCYNK